MNPTDIVWNFNILLFLVRITHKKINQDILVDLNTIDQYGLMVMCVYV